MNIHEKSIVEKVAILERELTYKNEESLSKVLKLIEQITYATLDNQISLETSELLTLKLFTLYANLTP